MKATEIQAALKVLRGFKLSIARRAGNMANFQFGDIVEVEGGTLGEYALHVQCPWRIDGPEGVITGRYDLWRGTSGAIMPDDWEPGISDNLQDRRLGELFQGYDAQTESHVNATEWLVVERVQASAVGDATIYLSGGYRLMLFPSGSTGEEWRIFRPRTNDPHFVVAG
jgi:hypothetical protein